MQYQLRQKILAFGDDFTIKDVDGNDRFFVDGQKFAFGDKLSFQDMQGQELLSIEQKVLSWGKTYHLLRGDRKLATIKKKPFTFFGDVFEVEDAAAGDLDAEGNFTDREYKFTRDGNLVATVSKKRFSLSDSYGIDVVENEGDHALILACAVIIDLCSHDS